MAVKKHPDYQKEVERLEFTKQAIKNTIELIDKNKQDYQKNIRVAFENLDYLDSSQSYITILTNSKFIELDDRNREKLVNIRKKPYFGRVDFKNNGHQKAERVYLGKAPLYRNNHDQPLIVDWRAPIANVYYEGRLGEMSYETPSGTVGGELVLKRQYAISDGELENIMDIDLTTTDTFLQSSLKVEADNRLKDIAATIQAEQNRIIRADLNLPLIVQGVAGSGKTTIALHRIAYLIYTYEKDFIPENFMIIAPNKLFLNYISEVLPELGVERVNQITFTDLIYQLIGKKYKLASPDEKLMSLINEDADVKKAALLKRVSAFKGSLEFKEIIDNYVDDLEQEFVPREDFCLGVSIILTSGDIYNIFTENYPYLPLYMRIKELKKLLSSKLKLASEKIYERLALEYEMQLDRVRANMTDGEEKSKRLVKLIDTKHNKLAHLQKEAKTVVNAYLARFPRQDLFTYYRSLIADEDNLSRYAGGRLDKEEIAFICDHSAKLLEQKQFEIEDSAGLIYLQYRLFGFAEKMDVSNVVIDEAQDFSIFQLYTLKQVLETSRFTILGDLSQGIYYYRGINDWREVAAKVFNEECNYLTLEQSYRTTIEIMNLANEVIKKWPDAGIIPARPVIRHGELPQLVNCGTFKDMTAAIKARVKELKCQHYKSLAIICKTLDECKKVHRQLAKEANLMAAILTGKEDTYQGGLVILPACLAKGLEFDAVLIIGWDSSYTQTELDIKLLYVAMTRAHHRLYILQKDRAIELLEDVRPKFYQRIECAAELKNNPS